MFSLGARGKVLDQHEPEQLARLSAAVARVVQDDQVVVELDAGLGSLTCMLAGQGCARVVAVETSDLAGHLRAAVEAAGLTHRVTLVTRRAELWDLDRADILVTKAHLSDLHHARLWSELGALQEAPWFETLSHVLPSRIRASAALCSAPEAYAEAMPWRAESYGLSVAALTSRASLQPVSLAPHGHALAAPLRDLGLFHLGQGAGEPRFGGSLSVTPDRRTTLHGAAVCFSVALTADDPLPPPSPEGALLVPLEEPIVVAAGETRRFELEVDAARSRWCLRAGGEDATDEGPDARSTTHAHARGGPQAIWRPRGRRLPLVLTVLRELDQGVARSRLLPRVYAALDIRDANDRRVVRQQVQWLLSKGIWAHAPAPPQPDDTRGRP